MIDKYNFNGLLFRSKKAVQDYIRGVVNDCPFDLVIDETHKHYPVFKAIVMDHINKEEKLGCGIQHFVFVVGAVYKEKQLNVIRTDGSIVSMSYLYNNIICEASYKQQQVNACRDAIYDQIMEYRFCLEETPSCSFCGATDKGIHIDHIYPFSKLLTEYLASIENKQFEFVKNPIKKTYEFKDGKLPQNTRHLSTPMSAV